MFKLLMRYTVLPVLLVTCRTLQIIGMLGDSMYSKVFTKLDTFTKAKNATR